jgi:transposase InsO family protein
MAHLLDPPVVERALHQIIEHRWAHFAVLAARLAEHNFTAEGPNQLWLSDITEHPTREGKLYLCAIKDAFSNRIVGYCMDSG